MKYCPICNRTFTDDGLGFCTDDGTVLLAGAAPLSENQETKMFSGLPPATAVIPPSNPTDYGLGSQPATPTAPAPVEPYRWANEAPPVWTPPPPPPVYPAVNQAQQTLAILSLVFGLAAITFGWICGGLILAIVGLILGFVALSQIKKNPTKYGGRPMAIGGIVTGAIVIVIHLVILAIWIVAMALSAASR
jgi:hypothetical protein